MLETLSRPVDILLVEDNPGDVRLIQEALKAGTFPSTLHHVADGVEALAYLADAGQSADSRVPDLILLDLNMPRMNGKDVLASIKTDERLARIPVAILTTSNGEADVQQSYGLHANCYIVKPTRLEEFVQTLHALENFWFNLVQLPSPDWGPQREAT